MQGKIYKIVKILGRMNSRTVMMERFQDARVLMTLLSTEDSNDSQKRMRAVLTIHPTLAYPFFSLIRPLFLRVLPKGGRICEGLLYSNPATGHSFKSSDRTDSWNPVFSVRAVKRCRLVVSQRTYDSCQGSTVPASLRYQ